MFRPRQLAPVCFHDLRDRQPRSDAATVHLLCLPERSENLVELLHSFFPTIGDGYPRDWPGTLRSIGELEFQKVIGGHGGVLESPARARQMRDYLEELLEIVARAKHDGVPLDRLQQTITPASLKTLQGGYGDYLAGEVKKHDFRVYLSTQSEVMARGVRDNLSAVYRNYERA